MTIDICFALYDPQGTYSRNVGIAMQSIFEHTKENVCVHLLHDDTLTADNREKFDELVKNAGQSIEYHRVQLPDELLRLEAASTFGPGALFRLMLPELLDPSIQTTIYFDADILVTCDVADFYRLMEGAGASVLVVKGPSLTYFAPKTRRLFDAGVLDEATYFNSGVMVFNLRKVRANYDIRKAVFDFFRTYPDCSFADQDAYNYIFLNDKKLIDGRYNCQSLSLRGEGRSIDGIYHFAGDTIRPVPEESFETLYFETWKRTPWGDTSSFQAYYISELQTCQMQLAAWRTLWTATRSARIVLFGARSVLTRRCIEALHLDPANDLAMDNAPSLWGKDAFGLTIASPAWLKSKEAKDVYVIVLSNLHYPEIKQQLETEYGLRCGEHFIDGRRLLENVKFFAAQ